MHKLFLLLLFLCGCSSQKSEVTIFEDVAMTVPYRIVIGQRVNESQQKEIEQIITKTFAEINTIYNNWNKESEISTLNKLTKQEKKILSPKLCSFLNKVGRIVNATSFLFDPTVYPLYSLWDENLAQGQLPLPSAIIATSALCGWKNIHFEGRIFWKTHTNTTLDLCGVAKGYGVDLLTERFQELELKSGLVEWGGELKAFGEHPRGRPWKIAIAPAIAGQKLLPVLLENRAVATSGDTWNYWEIEGQKYCHIIDPRTAYPIEMTETSIASVTVMADNCLDADAIATTLMLFPDATSATEFGEKLKIKFPDIQFWIQSRGKAHE